MALKTAIQMRLFFIGLLLVFSIAVISQNQVNFGEMKLPVRMTRTIGASGSMGWNGIVGIGATLQYYITPHIGLDAGAGLAASGYKFSGRLRYIILEKNFSPIVGVGYMYSTGHLDQILEVTDSLTSTTVQVEILPSSFIQIVAGAELLVNKGFFVMMTVGYAIQVNTNISLLSGTPNSAINTYLKRWYGSGIVMEFSIGYVFGNKGKFKGKF